MLHLEPRDDGSVTLVADRRLYPRAMVKRAAANVVERCHVLLDLDESGNVVAIFRPAGSDRAAAAEAAGLFGNLLLAAYVARHAAAHETATRHLLLARALDGALPLPNDPGPGARPTPEDADER
jgi:hypothetical protein